MGRMTEHIAKDTASLIAAPNKRQRFDQPEGADVERSLGRTEIVFRCIAKHVIAAAQVPLDSGEGLQEARIIRL